jgi:hypothetical protein
MKKNESAIDSAPVQPRAAKTQTKKATSAKRPGVRRATLKETEPVAEVVRTPEIVSKLVEALGDGCSRRAACGYAGIGEELLEQWVGEDAEFGAVIAQAEAAAEAAYTRVLAGSARSGDWRAAESWLKRRRREEWSERQEVTGAHGRDVAGPTVIVLPANGREDGAVKG